MPKKFRFIWPNGFRGEESNFFNSFLFFNVFFPLIFKFEKWQQQCLMAVEVIIHGLKENYICIVFTFLSYHLIFKLFSENEKSSFFWKSPIYDPLSDIWLLTLVAYEKWLLSLLSKVSWRLLFRLKSYPLKPGQICQECDVLAWQTLNCLNLPWW
jgi:hypothetical protein